VTYLTAVAVLVLFLELTISYASASPQLRAKTTYHSHERQGTEMLSPDKTEHLLNLSRNLL